MTRTILAAALLALTPLSAYAACWSGHEDTATMTCADGMVYDASEGACVDQTTS
ncbi:Chitin binding Peritrophin-A domain-containing protein [Tranquillimonas rosea]|uniref:Chitin binding Peritrophin-A domain-containing protein n=1 Tax=Tranquillimonas rosea TaxID=641238 RepID=A0A1H9TJL8_9RHOB|nr:chitin-binding domain-containing protein [Tranquillimonas rosea]SER97298.1 Chitin binding Peritrophin-A domain-containing protein [Tranquillimonas rosea]